MSAAQWHENNNEACRSDATPAQVAEAHREGGNQMSAPTPRTDAVVEEDMKHNKSFLTEDLLVHAYTLERELATERQKVRALTATLESICEEWGRNHDANPIGAGQRMETLASKALEKLEDAT